MFLLLGVSFPNENVKLQKDKSLIAALGIEEPIKAMVGKKTFDIGTKDEFLHRRLQIQSAFRRAQISIKYNIGGKGREKKIQALDRFKKAEKNYVTAKIHEYSRRLVDLALKHECGKIVLVEHKDTCEKTTGDLFLLRNWSYHGLTEKIQYKCDLYGVELIKE
jgi:IS605 OrfB family transposase